MQLSFARLSAILTLVLAVNADAKAQIITLQNATATFSQTSFGGQPVGEAIDGSFASNNGWSIYQGVNGDGGNVPGLTNPQIAAFETLTNVSLASAPILSFTLTQNFTTANPHTVGRFRLSATTDDRSQFADGLAAGGDVTANWVELVPFSAVATNGATLSILGDNSLLAGGPNPATSIYTVNVTNLLDGITGFRLEVLADPSFPDMGPGRAPNGNFALTELQVTGVPEPTSLALISIGVVGWIGRRRMAAAVVVSLERQS